ncbi:mannitol dehydrogenase [Sporanaerobium hydrogeniformans]|uniref:Mannitol dehydrogenase n=1 Tax=Sporanaerobium hydrogeniformans TaxID=3072179 RepID=A0AC61DDB2_9FIRM|nr:mannitol dehydrogenase family protein [Sporanaerobium hydrogeniformans]PHV71191.1 mannitol dehydrogenase [Sporanaerobium hydrogeniformans]
MKLSNKGIENRQEWETQGFELPHYDREIIKRKTLEAPTWLHFGAGNIFRGFTAACHQTLLNEGKADTGIIVAEGYDYELIDRAYKPYDDLSLLVILKADGSTEKKVIGSVVESLKADSNNEKDWNTLKELFKKPSLQMVSFTITEKGYSLKQNNGDYFGIVEKDFEKGPSEPQYFMGKLTALCYERYLNGKKPIALVSMDNCSHNGTKLYEAVSTYAKVWAEKGLVEADFVNYINNPECISFPWSMIDKITPRPDASVKADLERLGFEDTDIICTDKNTYTAPFVNAEAPQYLVIEDLFPNGRPCLEEAGVIFTDRKTVDKVEKMKVCTCLNPLHTALAVYGCLLSHTLIYEEMRDPLLKNFIEKLAYEEGIKVVVDPGIIRPSDFIKEVIEVRFPNPFMPDAPQRIATDTSQKLPIRFGETIKAYAAREDLEVADLKLVPLVLAGWCRYLLGVNDEGEQFEISPDPMLEVVSKYLEGIKLGAKGPFTHQLKPILSDKTLFGVDLYEVGLGEKVEGYFEELVAGIGAVKRTLAKYTAE